MKSIEPHFMAVIDDIGWGLTQKLSTPYFNTTLWFVPRTVVVIENRRGLKRAVREELLS